MHVGAERVAEIRNDTNETRILSRGGSSIRPTALPEILTKFELNIWIKVFVARYALALKQYE